jgi:hypothetical protein
MKSGRTTIRGHDCKKQSSIARDGFEPVSKAILASLTTRHSEPDLDPEPPKRR